MDLLRLLSDGQFHSGVQLAERFGVSRSTISNRIAAWCEAGLVIDSVTGKGYRLHSPIEWLDRERIQSLIPVSVRQHMAALIIEPRVSSTSDVVATLMSAQGRPGIVCVAEMQEAGRGRRGKDWVSPPGGNFYGSVGWIYSEGVSALEGLSLAVGVAVIQALESLGVSGLQLKWPNDILHEGRKLAGVLIEMTGEASGPCHVVVGVGVNLRLPRPVRARIAQPVTDLDAICATPLDRQQVTAALITELVSLLASYQTQRFAPWRLRWLRYDALNGQAVTLQGLQQPVDGIAQGVDEQGALRLNTEQGLVMVHGGEVSLRRKES